jgi:hypothetical protein
VAKGGSYGDRWQMLMVCARAGTVGDDKCELSLRYNNRADSLGLRLVRHPDRPGFDLMVHSIRRLGYDSAAADWSDYPPHAFALERIAGRDDVKIHDSAAPYVHFTRRAHGVAVAPLWVTSFNEAGRREAAKPERNRYDVLGALRSDVPFRAGVCLTVAEQRELLHQRELYKKYVEEYNKLPKDKKKNVQLPPEPPAPDDYEKLTDKNKEALGLFREKTVAPGEWFVVYWNGFIGLANRNFTMPPDAIIKIDPKQVARKSAQPGASEISIDGAAGEMRFRFQVWEQPSDKNKQVVPPDPAQSEEWALYEACPSLFIKGGAGARPYCWDIDVGLKLAPADDPLWKDAGKGLVPDVPARQPNPTGKDSEDKKPTGK